MRICLALLMLFQPGSGAASVAGSEPSAPKVYRYHPKRRVPPSLEAAQKYLAAGSDAFPEEKEAEELAAGSASWARACARARPARVTPWSRSSPPSSRAAA